MKLLQPFLLSGTLCLLIATATHAQQKQDPAFKLPEGVEMKKDVVYGKGGERDLKLDLFLPKASDGLHPGIVFIHGGGWSAGNKGAFRRQAAYLASKGYVGACIEYRLSGEATFPAAIEDCKCAVRWLKANAKNYRVDTNRVATCGGSAGGHLASLVGVSSAVTELEGKGGHNEQSSEVRAVVAFNGVFDFVAGSKAGLPSAPVSKFLGGSFAEKEKAYRLASPLTHVCKASPPHLFLHGTADTTVPIQQSKDMLKKLKDAGVVAELYAADGAGHGFFNRPPHYEPTLKRMEEFLDNQLKKR